MRSASTVGGAVYDADMAEIPISVGDPPAVDVAFRHAADVFDAVVAQVPAHAWGNDSPCAGWVARDVVGHVIGTMGKASVVVRGGSYPTGPSTPGDAAGIDPVKTWRAAVRPVLEALRSSDMSQQVDSPHGTQSVGAALAFPVADLAVHAWDLARATAQPFALPDELLAHVASVSAGVPEERLRGPNLFDPARPVPEGADDTTALMAWLGREVTG